MCERESKTKAFSKVGLQLEDKVDPNELALHETADWLRRCLCAGQTRPMQLTCPDLHCRLFACNSIQHLQRWGSRPLLRTRGTSRKGSSACRTLCTAAIHLHVIATHGV